MTWTWIKITKNNMKRFTSCCVCWSQVIDWWNYSLPLWKKTQLELIVSKLTHYWSTKCKTLRKCHYLIYLSALFQWNGNFMVHNSGHSMQLDHGSASKELDGIQDKKRSKSCNVKHPLEQVFRVTICKQLKLIHSHTHTYTNIEQFVAVHDESTMYKALII